MNPEQMDTSELVDAVMSQENMYSVEGRTGLINLCRLVSIIGYKDPNYYGNLGHRDAHIGDLILFLEDNSGCIESMIDWVKEGGAPEWNEALRAQLPVYDPVAEAEQEKRENADAERAHEDMQARLNKGPW